MSEDGEEVVVVGGGVVGVCCAYFLARAGQRVRLFERADLCSDSSYGNAGLVAPGRSLPLSMPGAIGKALRGDSDPDGQFRLKPRPDRELAAWLWRFRKACRPETVRRATILIRNLTRRSLALYEQLANVDGLEFGFRRRVLVLFRTTEGRTAYIAEAETMGEYGVASEPLDSQAVRRLEPRVAPEVAGGVLYPEDSHLDPPRFLQELARRAAPSGEGCASRPERRSSGFGWKGAGSQASRLTATSSLPSSSFS